MTASCPRILIAGTHSGVGKTTITLGMARAFADAGLRVQCFKVGPDYLDPTYLKLASRRTCYNLDTWMGGKDYAAALFAKATADADLAIIEGVMGLFDGAEADANTGSSADIAALLGAPIALIADAKSMGRSFAAMVKGYATFDPGTPVAGVIANRTGSDNHLAIIKIALSSAGLPALLGNIKSNSLPDLASRHLGLVAAEHDHNVEKSIAQAAQACREQLKLDNILALAKQAAEQPLSAPASEAFFAATPPQGERPRIGMAWDKAFHFYYPDNLEALEAAGAEIVRFSPLSDKALPPRLSGLYFGGGYPEVHAEHLSHNKGMREAVKNFSESGRVVYGECAGLMYLGTSLQDMQNLEWPMTGLAPYRTRMLPRLKRLGYAQGEALCPLPWGEAGIKLRGHEFHYSEMLQPPSPFSGWKSAYRTAYNRGALPAEEGFVKQRTLVTYLHAHFASQPELCRSFVNACRENPPL